MKSIFAVVLFAVASFSASAGVMCTTNSFGQTYCSGTDSQGQSVNTTTTTNSFGQSYTSGSIGGQSVQQTCTTNSFGQTYCN